MKSYRVPKAPDHPSPVLYLSAAALVFAALLSLGMQGIATVPVAAQGQARFVTLGTTVADATEAGLIAPRPGDIVDATGTVLAQGRGEPGTVLVNGEVADPDHRLRPGDVLTSRPGADTPESIVTTREPIPIPIEYEGNGPLVAMASPGAVGVRETTLGEVSRVVVDSRVVTEAEPMVLRRYATSTGERVVALTFDDGPWPTSTLQICEILEREGVPGNFFMLGKQVRRYRELAQRVAAGGHLIGNHSLSHVYMRAATPELARSEIENAQDEIERTIGQRPTWYRPAGGIVSPAVWAQTRASKVRLINWTVDPQDYRCESPTVLAQRVIGSVHPGAVVLLHDGGGDRSATVKALTTIIRTLKAQGYTFVTLDDLYPE